MNTTETRALLRMATGARAPRHYSDDQVAALMDTGEHPATAQSRQRELVQAYLQRNWSYVKELVPCEGDCASSENACSDAQASTCYHDNLTQIEG